MRMVAALSRRAARQCFHRVMPAQGIDPAPEGRVDSRGQHLLRGRLAKRRRRRTDKGVEVASLERDHQAGVRAKLARPHRRSEEHTSELQSLMRISYAVFCLKKKT